MPTVSYNKFFPFVEKLDEGVFNFQTDQITVALSNSAPSAANAVLADITQISYTNLSTRNVTTVSSSQTGGVYKLVCSTLTLTASGGSVATFQYIVLYDSTASGSPLIAWYDYGSALTLNDGDSLAINFTLQTNGVFMVT